MPRGILVVQIWRVEVRSESTSRSGAFFAQDVLEDKIRTPYYVAYCASVVRMQLSVMKILTYSARPTQHRRHSLALRLSALAEGRK